MAEETVNCQMARDRIAISLCETEQGGPECRGCRAPSRRCVGCNQKKEITDQRRWLCPDCKAAQERISLHPIVRQGSRVPIERLLELEPSRLLHSFVDKEIKV